nr:uncharacterized protein LOC117683824 [Crassostrea gigas]
MKFRESSFVGAVFMKILQINLIIAESSFRLLERDKYPASGILQVFGNVRSNLECSVLIQGAQEYFYHKVTRICVSTEQLGPFQLQAGPGFYRYRRADLVLNSSTTQTTSILSSTSTSNVGITTSSDPQISLGVAISTEITSFYNTDETSSSTLASSVVTNVTSSSEALVTLSSTHLSSEQSKWVTEMDSAISTTDLETTVSRNFDLGTTSSFTNNASFSACNYANLGHVNNWFTAKTDCEATGGYLVELASVEEANFILNNVIQSRPAWLGGHRNGTWFSWSRGGAVTYTDWMEGFPKNVTGEDCLVWATEGWNDAPCDKHLKEVICELDECPA